MPLEVRRTRYADRDLQEIWLYVRGDSQRAADGLIQRLNEIFDRLAASPEIGRARPDVGPGLRSFPNGRYGIFYRFNGTTLTIVRVLSSYRDLSAQTFPDR
jgi:toxin ParE1/3/4